MDKDLEYGVDQIKKNLILLQDHATSYPCPSCMSKHLKAIEAYSEEIIPMTKNRRFKEFFTKLSDWARKLGEIFE